MLHREYIMVSNSLLYGKMVWEYGLLIFKKIDII